VRIAFIRQKVTSETCARFCALGCTSTSLQLSSAPTPPRTTAGGRSDLPVIRSTPLRIVMLPGRATIAPPRKP
jgi:hypothetical protein